MKKNQSKKISRIVALSTATAVVATTGAIALPHAEASASVIHMVEFAETKAGESFKDVEITFPGFSVASVLDASKITIDESAAVVTSATITGNKLILKLNSVDPSPDEIVVRIAPGALSFNGGYNQVSDLEIGFAPYDVMPNFNEIFKENSTTTRANDIFSRNTSSDVWLYLTGSYIQDIRAAIRFGDNVENHLADIIVETKEVEMVTIEVNGVTRSVVQSQNATPDVFRGTIQGININDDVTVNVYDASGVLLESQTVLLANNATNFNSAGIADYTEKAYTVQQYLENDVSFNEILNAGNVRVGYTYVPYIQYAGNASELAVAMAKLSQWRLTADPEQMAVIRLTDDITGVTSSTIQFDDVNYVITSDTPGVTRTITTRNGTGSVNFGSGSHMNITLKDVDIIGNANININTGDANFTNANISGTTTITSAGNTSVYLTDFETNVLRLANQLPVRVVANSGTAITETIVNNSPSADTTLVQNGGSFNAITKRGTSGTGVLFLQNGANATPFQSLTVEGTGTTTEVELGANVTLETLHAKKRTTITGGTNSSVTTATATGLNTGDLVYSGVVIDNASDLGTILKEEESLVAGVVTASKPTVAELSLTSFDLNLQSNRNGKVYYIVVPKTATPPTAAQVRAGSSYAGVTIAASGNDSVIAGTPITKSITTGLAQATEYAVYVVAEDSDDNLSAVQSVMVTTNQKSLRLSGSAVEGLSEKDLRTGGKKLVLGLNGTVKWNRDVLTDSVTRGLLATALGNGTPLAGLGAADLNGQLELSSSGKSLTITLPALSDTDANTIATAGSISVGTLDPDLFVHLEDGLTSQDNTLPTVIGGSIDVTVASNLADITLVTSDGTDPAEMIRAGVDVDFTLDFGGLTPAEFVYSIGNGVWTQGTSATGVARAGQTITVRENANPNNMKSFTLKAGEAWVGDGDDLINVMTQDNINAGLRVIHVGPNDGNPYSRGSDDLETVTIPSGQTLTFKAYRNIAGDVANLDFNGDQDLSRFAFTNDGNGSAIVVPTITGVTVYGDGEGNLGDIVITFSQAVQASEPDGDNAAAFFTIGGEAGTEGTWVNDRTLRITELASDVEDTSKPEVVYLTAGDLANSAEVEIVSDITILPRLIVDAAPPVAELGDGNSGSENEQDSLVVEFSEELYRGGVELEDGLVTSSFTASNGVTITSATYDKTAKTVTFVLENAETGSRITHNSNATALRDKAGNVYAPEVYTFDGTNWTK